MTRTVPLSAPHDPLRQPLLDVMEREHARCVALAFRLMGNDADARDAVQEAWVRAWRCRDAWSGEGDAGAWVRAILVRECMRSLKWRSMRRWLPFGADVPDVPAPITAAPLDVDRVRQVVTTLPAQQRVVFTLRFDEGWTLPEIATSLHISPETVKTHLARALDRVRAALGVPHVL